MQGLNRSLTLPCRMKRHPGSGSDSCPWSNPSAVDWLSPSLPLKDLGVKSCCLKPLGTPYEGLTAKAHLSKWHGSKNAGPSGRKTNRTENNENNQTNKQTNKPMKSDHTFPHVPGPFHSNFPDSSALRVGNGLQENLRPGSSTPRMTQEPLSPMGCTLKLASSRSDAV